MIPADRISSVEEYYFSKKLREIKQMQSEGKDIINLGIGSPDLPPSERVIARLKSVSEQPGVHGYQSYTGIPELRNAIAGFHQKWFDTHLDGNSEILPLMGSKEGITHISLAFLNKGDSVLIPELGYPTYTSVTRMVEAEPVYYRLQENGAPDLEFLQKEDFADVKLMWINFPHMPTGFSGSEDLFKKLVEFAKENNILLIHDNPYSFILNDSPRSILQLEGAKELSLELHSLSKSFNMAGWRVGWLAGDARLISNVLRIKSNMDSGMFRPVQEAAIEALSLGREWFDELNAVYASRKKLAKQFLDKIHCEYSRDQTGMFIWAQAAQGDGESLVDELLYEKNIFITPGSVFGKAGKAFVRLSLCSNGDTIKKAIDRL